MNIKEILAKLTIEELRQIKENPYIIDELIYEKATKQENNPQQDLILSVGENPSHSGNNWLDNANIKSR